MNKIELPPKVKCWDCINGKIIVSDLGPNEPGPPAYTKDCPFCDDGERYVFDDLAATLSSGKYKLHRILVERSSNNAARDKGKWQVIIEHIPERYYYGYGPSPTTALLNAITKFNEET